MAGAGPSVDGQVAARIDFWAWAGRHFEPGNLDRFILGKRKAKINKLVGLEPGMKNDAVKFASPSSNGLQIRHQIGLG